MRTSELIDIFDGKARRDSTYYSPLRIERYYEEQSEVPQEDSSQVVEPMIDIRWRDNTFRGVIEAMGQATPRKIRRTLEKVKEWDIPAELGAEPLLLVPYLSGGIAEELERTGISGIDLNGNFLIMSSGLVAIRLDQPNEYPASRDIKKVYSYNSSIVGRCLLRKNRTYEQVNEIYEEIQRRGGGVSLSTVSKVLKTLDEDLIISKERGEIRVLQPDRLLNRLREGYRKPQTGRSLRLKLPESERAKLLDNALNKTWVCSGKTSAIKYAATTPPAIWNIYATSYAAMDNLSEFEDQRFYNCVLEKCDDHFIYFDSRTDDKGRWTSPVETYLALSQLDKRDREVAKSIRENIILAEFDDV